MNKLAGLFIVSILFSLAANPMSPVVVKQAAEVVSESNKNPFFTEVTKLFFNNMDTPSIESTLAALVTITICCIFIR